MSDRSAGILLHVTSLPGSHGIGDLGPGARAFADWLAAAGQRWWQMLPINPVGVGDSPYSGASAFAGEPMLISLDDLVEEGLLDDTGERVSGETVNYKAVRERHDRMLRRAFTRFRVGREYERFERESAHWLDDHALFQTLRRAHPEKRWTQWPAALRRREPSALADVRREQASEIAFHKFAQFIFAQQWARLRSYCRERNVGLIGDIPIFVSHESADVWSHPEYFTLDEETGEPTAVAGVPPDYFSETGQRWGNPHYRWKRLAKDSYSWWIDRCRTLLERFDLVRIDHFIGFARYWKIPAEEKTAVKGRYVRGPREHFFTALREALGRLPFIAEDLGSVTPAVIALRDRFELPGMRVFQFAFGTDVQARDFLPHRYPRNTVAYTGTHDNDTIVGWWDAPGPRSAEQAAKERAAAIEYLAGPGAKELRHAVHIEIIRALYASVADTVIVPMQDVLGLGSETRMNQPGVADGNWAWRIPQGALTPARASELRALASLYERETASNAS